MPGDSRDSPLRRYTGLMETTECCLIDSGNPYCLHCHIMAPLGHSGQSGGSIYIAASLAGLCKGETSGREFERSSHDATTLNSHLHVPDCIAADEPRPQIDRARCWIVRQLSGFASSVLDLISQKNILWTVTASEIPLQQTIYQIFIGQLMDWINQNARWLSFDDAMVHAN